MLCTAGYDWKSFRLLLTYFWHRLLGTGGIWFCNDWYFYGNGVFRSTFVGLLVGSNASVQVNWLYSYINAGVQLVGYYCAANTVDFRAIGRRRLTVFSFCMVSRYSLAAFWLLLVLHAFYPALCAATAVLKRSSDLIWYFQFHNVVCRVC